MSDLSHYEQEQMTNSLKRSNSILKNKLDLERQRSEVLVEICRKLKKYHAFFPDAQLFLEFENALKKYEELK